MTPPEQPDQEQRRVRGAIPWAWLLAGLAVTLIALAGLAWWVTTSLLAPPDEAVAVVEPTIIRLTAPPQSTATATPPRATRTPIPTFTPIPTPDNAVAPETVTPGYYAAVANTDDLGVTVRGGPSTQNVALTVAQEGQVVLVLDGPVEADNFVWWQIQLQDGTEGWAVANYLEPAAAP